MASFYITVHYLYYAFTYTGPTCTRQVMDKSDGKSSNCLHVGGSGSHTLASCKTATQAANANVFNFKNGACYFKQCDDVTDLKPTTLHGGWDVYVLECGG